MIRTVLGAVAVLLFASQCYAERNSHARVQAFAALPDWTGLWQSEAARVLSSHVSGHIEDAEDSEELALFALAGHPPLNADWERKYQATVHDQKAAAAAAASAKLCRPAGFPMMMDWATLFQVVVTPEETLFIGEDGAVRHVYTDGRTHPGADDLWPTPMGDSIGHWEGGTLVIDTVARAPGPIMLSPAVTLSDRAHFTERVRLVNSDTLEDQMTIDDPLRFTRPWQVTVQYSRVTGINRMVAWDCQNDRNPVMNGKLTIAPP